MPDTLSRPRRIAIIGGGISGMGAAYHLAKHAQVTLYEAEPRLGGHACTIMAGKYGDQPVDIGFIVFNHANYPHLTQLFAELDVPIAKSAMTFGASINGGAVEYALRDLNGLFAQRRNIARPAYYRMLRDILRFNARAPEFLAHPEMTVGDMLAELGTGEWFRNYYLLPFSGAIWSTPTEDITSFPAAAMIRFFQNHNLLDYKGQHQWYTVKGGSKAYVTRLKRALNSRGVEICCGAAIDAVRRPGYGVEIKPKGADWIGYDEVVFATHADDTLRLLADPSDEERGALGAVAYQPNTIILHSDTSLMPKRKAAWASWVYTEDAAKRSSRIDLTYWMNSLQPIPDEDQLFVTLNTTRQLREEKIYHQTEFRHPVYDHGTLAAQAAIKAMNGARHSWFCGAWMRNGFHEDGLASGIEVANGIAKTISEAAPQ
ncbi:MAG: NAD(P)/FAD-dependent oxidoreductase [Mangrovicoccus sp.]